MFPSLSSRLTSRSLFLVDASLGVCYSSHSAQTSCAAICRCEGSGGHSFRHRGGRSGAGRLPPEVSAPRKVAMNMSIRLRASSTARVNGHPRASQARNNDGGSSAIPLPAALSSAQRDRYRAKSARGTDLFVMVEIGSREKRPMSRFLRLRRRCGCCVG